MYNYDAPMPALLVDVADPGRDGDALAEALSETGFDVRRLPPEELRAQPTEAHLIILAGDVPQALDVLDHLRRTPETATVPVLLVGAPADGPSDTGTLIGLGADGVYGRPVPVARVVRKAQTFLTPSEQLSPSPEPHSAEAVPEAPEQASSSPAPNVPDSTLRLHSDADLWQHDSWVDGDPAPEEPGHGLSGRVLDLVRAADRRLFPEAPELPLSIIDPGESVDLLLADDLRQPVPLPEEPVAEPPFPHERRSGAPPGDSFADATTVVARATYRGGSAADGAAEGDRVVGLLTSSLADDLPALVVAGARERYELDDVLAHLDRTGRVRLFPEVGGWLESVGLEPAVVDWLQEHDGEVLERWVEGGPPGGGAPGLLLALVALKAVKIQTVVYTGRVEARAKVAAAHALAQDGDYFSILGVPQDAGTAEIEAAHALRYRELASVEGLEGDLAEKRHVALDALDEAREILGVGRLRSAYRQALERR